MEILNEGTARTAVRGRDVKGKTCFLLYSVDGTLVDSGTITDGAFDYSKSPDGYVIVSHLLTSTSSDEGTLAPTDWNTDVDLERLRLAECVLIADKSVNIVDALKVATKLDDLAPVSWCVVIGTPPLGSVEGKTTFFISDAPDANLKAVADPIVDKYDERVFILSNDMCGMLGTIAAQYTQEELVNRLIALSTPYEGRDEERAQELISKLAARRDSPIGESDERIKKVLPSPMKEFAIRLAAKFHTSVFAAAVNLLIAFVAKQGHHRARLKRWGGEVSPYLLLRLHGQQGAGKTPLVDFATAPLVALEAAEEERHKRDSIKIPALKAVFDEAEKRHKAAALALDAAKENGDPEEVKRADEAEKEASYRLGKASAEYWKVAAPPHKYLIVWGSDKGVEWDLSENEWSAEKQGKIPDGALVRLPEGSDIFGLTNGLQTTKKYLNAISRLGDANAEVGKTVSHEDAKTRFGRRKVGCCIITEEQPGTDVTAKYKEFEIQGGKSRFLEALMEYSRKKPTDDELSEPIENWRKLFFVDLEIDRLQLDEDARRLYHTYVHEESLRIQNDAHDLGDDPKVGFISKLDANVLRVARGFHLIKEASRILADGNDLVKVQIDADTIREAIEFCRVAIDERDSAREACRQARKTDLDVLSPNAQKLYQYLAEHAPGEWITKTRFASNLKIVQNPERRDRTAQELADAGHLIIGKYGQKKNKWRLIKLNEIAAPEKTDEIPF